MNDEILTVREAGEFLRLPHKTIEYYVQTQQIPYSRLGKRSVRFRKSRLLEWMNERESLAYHRGG